MRSQVTLWIGLSLVIAARLFAFWLIPLCAEDAYISFHAALDPAWRAATTSPLWAMLCGLGDPPTVARGLALVADCAAVWAAWRVLPGCGYWAFIALWLSPFFMGSAVSGLETHVAACALVLARAWPGGFTIAAALRPDAAVISLCASGRKWRWAVAGVCCLLLAALAYTGRLVPQTIGSKALIYGIHPGAWNWLHPQGFGWMTLALFPALWTRKRLYVAAALACLLAYVALGTVYFYWYAVPPLAMLGFAACERVRRPWHLALALVIVLGFWGQQAERLHSRVIGELGLWEMGQRLAAQHPTGMIMLEPAGMIPYQSPQLRVVDDVGLVDPWVAKRRAAGPGWRTDVLKRYRPRWFIMRAREVYSHEMPELMIGKYPPNYGEWDRIAPGYVPITATGAERTGTTVTGKPILRVNMKWSNLILFKNPAN